MPFCPKCRLEYRPGFSSCPDCNKQLVDHFPEPSEEPEEPDYTKDWVPIAQFAMAAYADMIAGGLKDLGIPAVKLSSTGHFGQVGTMGTTFLPISGAYIILVPPEQVEAADREGEVMLGDVWRGSRLGSRSM